MHDHDCGCKTDWNKELDQPVYLRACSYHRNWAAKMSEVKKVPVGAKR